MSKRKPNLVKVSIDLIGTMAEIQTREAISEQTVEDYKHAVENNEPLPPIDVAYIGPGGGPVVISGHHRLMAHEAAGHDKITCDAHYEIRNVAAALEFATKANREHGLRPSLKDRQRTLRLWMQHKRLFDKSDRSIAKAVGVDHKTVAALREKLAATGEIPSSTKRIGADGKARSMPKPKAEKPAPASTAEQTDEGPVDTVLVNDKAAVELVSKAAPMPAVETVVDDQECHIEHADSGDIVDAEQTDVGHQEDQDHDDEAGVEFNLADELVSLVTKIDNEVKRWPLDEPDAKRVADSLRRLAGRIEERVGAEVVA